MGWGSGVNDRGEEVGYLIPDVCAAPGCSQVIDRGLAYCCGGLEGEAFGRDGPGCGRYFCAEDLFMGTGHGAFLCKGCCDAWDKAHPEEGA